MYMTTKLDLNEQLPLTCSRSGTCCHGKKVCLNPYELASLANAKGITSTEFRDMFTDFGGIQLKFGGESEWRGLSACSMYSENVGCSVHEGRPLACRLYPLGRQKQGDDIHYMFQGSEFPCLDGCPEVVELPEMSVGDYIKGQNATSWEKLQDSYLEMMESIADGAFALLLDSGLAETGDRDTLQLWRKMGNESPLKLASRIGSEWIDLLMVPEVEFILDNQDIFVEGHHQLFQDKAQIEFGSASDIESFRKASVQMMGLALHLGRGLGANPADLAIHWIDVAKEHGALE